MRAGFAEALQALEAQLARTFPTLAFDPAGFARHLCERLPSAPALADALARVQAGDLYLAWACLARQDAAFAVFEADVMPLVARALRGVDPAPDFVADVSNAVRTRLWGADAARPPALQAYLGQGPLASFAMVIAMREAVDRKRQQRAHDPLGEVVQALEAAGPSADSVVARKQVAPHAQQALTEALAALTARQRTLLRLHLVQGFSAEKLARMYGVHRATTTRWLADARAQVLTQVSDALQTRLKVGPRTLDSLRRDLAAGVDVSISGMLGD